MPKIGSREEPKLASGLALKYGFDRRQTEEQILGFQGDSKLMKGSSSVRNLSRHQVIGSLEEFNT